MHAGAEEPPILVYTLALVGAGFFSWRATKLNGLPDVGDPFDVGEAVHVDVPDAENAFVLYRQAHERLKPLSPATGRLMTQDWVR